MMVRIFVWKLQGWRQNQTLPYQAGRSSVSYRQCTVWVSGGAGPVLRANTSVQEDEAQTPSEPASCGQT